MRDIEPIGAHGVIVEEDVRATLQGLTIGSRYAAADLYARYSDVAKEAGRSPGHPTGFGQALRRAGLLRVKMNVGGAGKGNAGRGRTISAWLF